MIGSIGSNALLVALAMAIGTITMLVIGARRDNAHLLRAGFAGVYTNFGLLAIAAGAMVVALVTHDFSVGYVAQVGSRSTPLLYTVISLWGALEGSILFWGFLLAGYGALAVFLNRARPGKLVPYAAATLLTVSAFFLILLVGPANPFGIVSPVPADGPGPNPLLQNHILMAIHPPLLYLGYVGFSVPFAFAVGAMLSGEANSDVWIRSTRLWTISAWGFLTAAIIAGMWWSYDVLGWGGYWAWDPVENASFMPWLTATAFLHSVLVQERRGMLKVWNLNLVVATFLLTILGTFLTRSGILSSVHAFTEGTIGLYFLVFIGPVLVVSLALVAGSARELRSEGRLDAVASRETVFLLNNLLLSLFCFTVLLGTLFPLVAEAARGVKVSVGAPFFNRMTLPLAVALVFLVGVGPMLPWRRGSWSQLRQRLVAPGIAALAVAVASITAGTHNVYAVLAFSFGAFAVVGNLSELWVAAAARIRAHGENALLALGRVVGSNRHRYGGYLAHIGIIVAVLGVAASSAFKTESEFTLAPGESGQVHGFAIRLDRMWGQQQAGRVAVGADVTVLRGTTVLGTLAPRQNFYESSDQPFPAPDVLSGFRRDIYVNLMAFKEDGSSATFHAFVEPMVAWIWAGGGIVVFAVLFALWPAPGVASPAPEATPPRPAPSPAAPAKRTPRKPALAGAPVASRHARGKQGSGARVRAAPNPLSEAES